MREGTGFEYKTITIYESKHFILSFSLTMGGLAFIYNTGMVSFLILLLLFEFRWDNAKNWR